LATTPPKRLEKTATRAVSAAAAMESAGLFTKKTTRIIVLTSKIKTHGSNTAVENAFHLSPKSFLLATAGLPSAV
jgi:hypothetical protein